MKRSTCIACIAIGALALCVSLFAATQSAAKSANAKGWTYDLGTLYCIQLVTDGSGGCVLVAGDAGMNSMYCQVVRLNAKGEVLFNAPYHNPIIVACNKKGFAFENYYNTRHLVSVNAKGEITETEDLRAPADWLNGPFMQRTDDSKGYFVESSNGVSFAIVRCSY